MLRVFIGYDHNEDLAYQVARDSLLRNTNAPVCVEPLVLSRFHATGILRRPVDARGGRLYDIHSNAPQATEFAISRFLVPLLVQDGPALFVDCDMVFVDDVAKLFEFCAADPTKAVHVVKHRYTPSTSTKMGGHEQVQYPCKNWSSVMLFNCGHRGHLRLSLDALNNRPGRDLHNFFWLADTEIGELPAGWNWLVEEQPRPDPLYLAHYTLGGPWIPGWKLRESDTLWLAAQAAFAPTGAVA